MKKCEIVSLGINCLPRTVLTRGGIKPRKAEGELSCPFDLVAHPAETVLKCLQTNFEGYFDDLFFKLRKKHFFDFRGKGMWQKEDGTRFFHDKDCKKNDREKLVQRVKKRIENFNNIVNSDKPIVFVMSVYSETICIDEIYEILKKIRKDKPFEFVVIAFNTAIESKNKDINILELPFPNKNFVNTWNRTYYVNSKLGKYIEKTICDFVQSRINKITYQ